MEVELANILSKYGIRHPDHRADIAEAAWNAAIEYAAVKAAKAMAEWDGSTFGIDDYLRDFKV